MGSFCVCVFLVCVFKRREEMSYYDEVVKLPKKLVAACMTCPICNNLYRDATTVAECLHTCKYSLSYLVCMCLN